jgi:hypothetical protein
MPTDTAPENERSSDSRDLEFAATSVGLAILAGSFGKLGTHVGNTYACGIGLLSAALWMFLAIHFYRRDHSSEKRKSSGFFAPVLAVAASIAGLLAVFLDSVCG